MLAPFYSSLPVTAVTGGIMFLDILVHIHEYIQYIGDTWRVFHCIWQRYPLGLNDELIRIWSSKITASLYNTG